MKKFLLISLSVLCFPLIKGADPDSLTLQSCLERITWKNTIIRQKEIAGNIAADKIKNIGTNWYPSVGVNAQALYNSETMEFSELLQSFPGQIPSLPLDQYKIWAEINQQIFDGGTTRILKEIERNTYQGDLQQNETEIHSLKSQVSQVYFSLISTQHNSEIIESSLNLLKAQKSRVQSGVSNGIIRNDDLLAIEAEEISLRQKITELKMMKKQLIRILSILTDSIIDDNTAVSFPDAPKTDQNGIRPEIKVFENQIERLRLNENLVVKSNLPRIFAFSQLAYGRPGFNMVSTDFHTFYTIGAGMKWNFINYGDNKRQQRILESQQELIDIRKKGFDDQIQVQLQTQLSMIEKYDSLIKQDLKILDLRKEIARISLSRMNNGTITSSEYLKDMNAELLVRLQLESHFILKRQAEYDMAMIQGKLKH